MGTISASNNSIPGQMILICNFFPNDIIYLTHQKRCLFWHLGSGQVSLLKSRWYVPINSGIGIRLDLSLIDFTDANGASWLTHTLTEKFYLKAVYLDCVPYEFKIKNCSRLCRTCSHDFSLLRAGFFFVHAFDTQMVEGFDPHLHWRYYWSPGEEMYNFIFSNIIYLTHQKVLWSWKGGSY